MNFLTHLKGRARSRSLRAVSSGATHETQFVPTPLSVARDMLVFAEAKPGDIVYDPGSGDGRIPILAAQEFGCRAVGIELDRKLYSHSVSRSRDYGLQDKVTFHHRDLFSADYRPATIVLLYLLSATTEHLQPLLASHLQPGARIVSLDFPIPGWEPQATREVTSVHGSQLHPSPLFQTRNGPSLTHPTNRKRPEDKSLRAFFNTT